MVKWLLKSIVGNRNQRVIKKLLPLVEEINKIEEQLQLRPESVLQEKTAEWKNHLERFSLRTESYSERVLENRTADENRELLTNWGGTF